MSFRETIRFRTEPKPKPAPKPEPKTAPKPEPKTAPKGSSLIPGITGPSHKG